MKKKECFRCGKVRPLCDFYVHSKMLDGHLNKCVECAKNDAEQRRQFLTATNPTWAAKEAQRQRDKEAKRYHKLKGTELYRIRRQVFNKKYAEKYPEKRRAHHAANNAVRDGRLKRKTACERCGVSGIRLEKHHADYSKPLEVEFLCRLCHKKETWSL